jgi:hypothetical protein
MPRVFRLRNYGVYVLKERGQPHHNPHAHIKNHRRLVASVFLVSLTVYRQYEPLPDDLMERLRETQSEMVDLWGRLNDDD